MADFGTLAALLETQATLATFTKAFKGKHALKHACDNQGNTLLHLAVGQNRVDVVKLLLEQHAPVAAANQAGQTALHLSALTTDGTAATALLSEIKSMPTTARQAVLEAKDAELGRTALHYAAKLGCETTVRQLIQAGASLDELTNTKHTALRSAAAQGHAAAVMALIAGQAKVSIPDAKGLNALHAAASIGSIDVVSALLDGQHSQTAVKACDLKGCSVLHYAISSGKPATQLVPLLDALMERGADRNAADSQGMTALHQAAKCSPCAVLDALLGPDAAAINSQDKEGRTALHYAADRGVQAAVKLLLDKGASAVIGDAQGKLPHELASGKVHNTLLGEAERQGASLFQHRAASPSASSSSQAASAGASQASVESKGQRPRAPQGMPFADISNTPTSRASEHASPKPVSHQGVSGVNGIAKSPRSSSQQDIAGAKGIARSPNGRKSLRRYSEGLENLQQQLQGVMTEGNQIQEYMAGAGTSWTKKRSAQQAQDPSGSQREEQSRSHKMQELREAYGQSENMRPAMMPATEGEEDNVNDRVVAEPDVHALRTEAAKVPGLKEQLSRMQAALDQWKTNDSVQLEAARKDVDKVKQQLEAQMESAKVASNQCKSTQTELKAVRQQLATQAAATQAGQAEIDSLRQELATQSEVSNSAQSELNSVRDSLRAQLSTTQAELANLQQQLSLRDESGANERKDFEIQTAELESSNRQQAQQLQKAEDEVQAMAFECRHLKGNQQQLVSDYDQKLAAATEAERAIGRAMTTQVESLQRQVASLTSLQAENEALKAAVEAKQQDSNRAQKEAKVLQQALSEAQSQEQKLQHAVAELQALQHTTAQRAEQLSKKGMQLTADKAAVESTLSLKEEESNSLKEEVGSLKSQALQCAQHVAALQNESAEQVRSISAGNAQLKLLQSKIKQQEEQLAEQKSQNKPQKSAPDSAIVLEASLWKQDHIGQMQQRYVQRLQKIRECCLPQPDAAA